MSHTAAARSTTRRTPRPTVAGLVAVMAVSIATLVASSTARWFDDVARGEHTPTTTTADGVVTEADGALPDGVTVFDDAYLGVANLEPDLQEAVRAAAADAAGDGIELYVNSGWRSPEYQSQLLREAVAEHGSAAEAARWVATPETSAHVSGHAVDIGPSDAAAWLSEHGAAYGLCQIYANESWHYELRPDAIDRGCPRMYLDPTHDPRMQRRTAAVSHGT
jgi:D-alanyl-D-alanine carboxypeptidase